jgi:hypothetical protein
MLPATLTRYPDSLGHCSMRTCSGMVPSGRAVCMYRQLARWHRPWAKSAQVCWAYRGGSEDSQRRTGRREGRRLCAVDAPATWPSSCLRRRWRLRRSLKSTILTSAASLSPSSLPCCRISSRPSPVLALAPIPRLPCPPPFAHGASLALRRRFPTDTLQPIFEQGQGQAWISASRCAQWQERTPHWLMSHEAATPSCLRH